MLHSVFPEERIFRIDHYLGKESVEDLLVFRFSNTLLEPVWNRNYVRSVQITMSETIGVEGRGSFYDGVGAIRDVMQNHLLQVLALAAMEPPVGPEASYLQDEKAKVFAAMRPIDPKKLVRGQYVGYRDEPGVAPDSADRDVRRRPARDRLVALGRRAVVRPLRQGLAGIRDRGRRRVPRATEPAVRRGGRSDASAQPGALPSRHATTASRSRCRPRRPGQHLDSQNVDVAVDFAAALGERHEAYERLLDDAIAGLPRRFAREDVVELTWRDRAAGARHPRRRAPLLPRRMGPRRSRSDPRRRQLVHPVVAAFIGHLTAGTCVCSSVHGRCTADRRSTSRWAGSGQFVVARQHRRRQGKEQRCLRCDDSFGRHGLAGGRDAVREERSVEGRRGEDRPPARGRVALARRRLHLGLDQPRPRQGSRPAGVEDRRCSSSPQASTAS